MLQIIRQRTECREETRTKETTMRLIGLLLIIFGVVALAVPSITFFTHERAVDTGFFHIDVAHPHTIILNPIAGIVAIIAGIVLVVAGRQPSAL
jgi:uncharacterized membrane protein HdeD (DUF308 family)